MLALVAIDQHNGIGKDGQLLQPIRADLKRFRQLTMGKVLIYGSKTLLTFPGAQVLAGRLNLILSRKLTAEDVPGAEILPSIPALLARIEVLKAAGRAEEDFCVIGGASVYSSLLSYVHKIYLTRIDHVFTSDAFFPELGPAGFCQVDYSAWQEESGLRFRYETWMRRIDATS